MADKTNNIIYNVEVNTNSGKISIDGLTKGFVDADRAVLKLQSDLNRNTKGIDKFTGRLDGASKAAGASTSATLELGRVLSDMPYGIRGVANNLQQLGSNLFFMSGKVDEVTGKTLGFKGAVNQVLGGLVGPAGLLIAFQGLIALWDYLGDGAKKAERDTRDFLAGIEDLLKVQTGLNDALGEYLVLQDLKESLDADKKKSNEELRKIDKERFENDKKKNALLTTIRLNEEAYANSKDKTSVRAKGYLKDEVANAKKLEELITKENELNQKRKSITGDYLEKLREYRKGKKDVTEAEATGLKLLKLELKKLTERRELLSETSQDYKRLTVDIDALQKKIDEIEGNGKRDKVEHFDIKGIKEGQGKVLNEVIKLNDKMLLASLKDKKSRLIVQRDFHIARLAAIHGNNSEIVQTYKKYYRQLIDTVEQGELELLAKEGAKGMGGAPRDKNKDAEAIKERERLLTQVKLEALMQSSQAIGGFLDGEFQRDITREKNKTNAINNELRERLNNENLSKSERKSIQLQIARNDEALRKKQEKIEKKRFKTQKAVNISQALLSTYLAVAQVQANPLDLNPVTKGISMAATLAMGLANVATIARQKFQSSAGATSTAGALGAGGGSSNGRGDRSFDFNLAGASRENQLAQTLQGRFDQPLQAYVVARDITNKQQLDEDIRNNASFG